MLFTVIKLCKRYRVNVALIRREQSHADSRFSDSFNLGIDTYLLKNFL